MSSSYPPNNAIRLSIGDSMNNTIEVTNYDAKGNKINPKEITLREKLIYELVKKYIKERTS